MTSHVISAQANLRSLGRSQNYMPPEAAQALEQAAKSQKTLAQ
jgi:hypothetical protein